MNQTILKTIHYLSQTDLFCDRAEVRSALSSADIQRQICYVYESVMDGDLCYLRSYAKINCKKLGGSPTLKQQCLALMSPLSVPPWMPLDNFDLLCLHFYSRVAENLSCSSLISIQFDKFSILNFPPFCNWLSKGLPLSKNESDFLQQFHSITDEEVQSFREVAGSYMTDEQVLEQLKLANPVAVYKCTAKRMKKLMKISRLSYRDFGVLKILSLFACVPRFT